MSRSVVFVIFCSWLTGWAAPQVPPPASGPAYLEGEVIVTFKSGVDLPAARRLAQTTDAPMVKHFAWLSEKKGRHIGLLRGRNGRTTASLINQLQNNPAVEIVEPNHRKHIFGVQRFNDPLLPQLWGLQNAAQSVRGTTGYTGSDVKFLSSWAYALLDDAANPPVIAVIDSGVFYTHPDLASNICVNAAEIAANGIDDDANGYIDDRIGYNFFNDSPDPSDSGAHGTHVSGTIAASANNGIGVVGVNWRAKILPLCVSGDGNEFSDASVIEAVQYAAMMRSRGVNVVAINASYGGPSYSSAERAAIESAGEAGIILCAAAGNDTANNDVSFSYPASYRLPNMIVVAASDQRDSLASFSNYGATTVDLAAPGVNILSTTPPATTSRVEVAAQVLPAGSFEFAGVTTGLTGILYDCGFGFPSNFTAAVSGNLALISRGGLFFSEKVANAMAAGAKGVIIYNNTSSPFSGTLQYASNWIPAVYISQADGLALLPTLPASATIYSAPDPANVYGYMAGTSMAAPHVAGAVSFAALNFPNDTVSQRVQRVLRAVDPLPALAGKMVTGGRLNLLRIVDADANSLPDWWEQSYFGASSLAAADPDHDGLSNAQEYWAGTDPTSQTSALRLTSVHPQNGGIQVQWVGGTQTRQFLQRTTTPALPNSWLDILTNEPPTSPTGQFLDLSPATNTGSYYRLRVETP